MSPRVFGQQSAAATDSPFVGDTCPPVAANLVCIHLQHKPIPLRDMSGIKNISKDTGQKKTALKKTLTHFQIFSYILANEDHLLLDT